MVGWSLCMCMVQSTKRYLRKMVGLGSLTYDEHLLTMRFEWQSRRQSLLLTSAHYCISFSPPSLLWLMGLLRCFFALSIELNQLHKVSITRVTHVATMVRKMYPFLANQRRC